MITLVWLFCGDERGFRRDWVLYEMRGTIDAAEMWRVSVTAGGAGAVIARVGARVGDTMQEMWHRGRNGTAHVIDLRSCIWALLASPQSTTSAAAHAGIGALRDVDTRTASSPSC